MRADDVQRSSPALWVKHERETMSSNFLVSQFTRLTNAMRQTGDSSSRPHTQLLLYLIVKQL